MKRLFFLFSLTLPLLAQASFSNLAGNYQCQRARDGVSLGRTVITEDGKITVIKGRKSYAGILVNRTEILHPLEANVGIGLYIIEDQNPVARSVKIRKKGEKLYIDELDFLPVRQFRSEDVTRIEFAPDIICTQAQ